MGYLINMDNVLSFSLGTDRGAEKISTNWIRIINTELHKKILQTANGVHRKIKAYTSDRSASYTGEICTTVVL